MDSAWRSGRLDRTPTSAIHRPSSSPQVEQAVSDAFYTLTAELHGAQTLLNITIDEFNQVLKSYRPVMHQLSRLGTVAVSIIALTATLDPEKESDAMIRIGRRLHVLRCASTARPNLSLRAQVIQGTRTIVRMIDRPMLPQRQPKVGFAVILLVQRASRRRQSPAPQSNSPTRAPYRRGAIAYCAVMLTVSLATERSTRRRWLRLLASTR